MAGRPIENNIEIDGARLRKAIKAKGYTIREFVFRIKGYEGKAANDWFSQICLPSGNKNKKRVSEDMLYLMIEELSPEYDLPEYLTGETPENIRTQMDLFFVRLQNHIATAERIDREAETLITPLLERAGFNQGHVGVDRDNDKKSFVSFKDSQQHEYLLQVKDLKTIERACIDLCASLIKNMSTDIKDMLKKSDTSQNAL